MDFVNNIDLEPRACRAIDGILTKLANLLYSVVCRAVDLDDVDILADVYCNTTVALATWLCGGLLGGKAVECFCQHPRHRCFADSPGARKKIGVCHPAGLYRVFERLSDGVLADDIIEALRPVFSCKNGISHFLIHYCLLIVLSVVRYAASIAVREAIFYKNILI